MPIFHIADSAFHQLSALQKSKGKFLRISVTSGGCSGFQYHFDLETKMDPEDIVIEKDSVKVIIDPISYSFLENAQLIYEQELIGAYFKIVNPNAEKSCGCGSSFSI